MNSAFKLIGLQVLTFAFVSISTSYFAQLSGENLVEHGSFEKLTSNKAPKKLDAIKSAEGWYSLTTSQAELFVPVENVPNSSSFSKCLNAFGREEPKTGENFAGISVYSPSPNPAKAKVPRSYLVTNLNSSMKKGMRYCVKFYVSLADLSKYSTNNIGAYFTKDDKEILSFADKPIALLDKKGEIILDQRNESRTISMDYGWEQICGTYVAKGGEKFMVLGNFFQDKETKFEVHKKDLKRTPDAFKEQLKAAPQQVAAYYYIDEVSVILLETGEECDCITASEDEEYSAAIYHKKVVITDNMSDVEKVEAYEVHFAITRADLSENGKESLNAVIELLKKNPSYKLEIQGHSDPEEAKIVEEKPDFAGMDARRGDVVYNYLKENGIDESRLMTLPMGIDEPSKDLDESDDPELHTIKDLRVTFKVRQ